MTDANEWLLSDPDPVDDHPPMKPYGDVLHPLSGKVPRWGWKRATNFADTIDSTFMLDQWKTRHVLKGLSIKPDALDEIRTLDVKADAKRLNQLATEARERSGANQAADHGTVVHGWTEHVDHGRPMDDVPEQYRADVTAYVRALKDHHLTVDPVLIERIVCLADWDVCGRFDRIPWERDGSWVIGDVKTKATLDYGVLEMEVQLAVYVHGFNENGIWSPELRQWLEPGSYGDSTETGPWSLPDHVRTDYGLVFHIPPGSGECHVVTLDLVRGWENAKLCREVLERRKHAKRKDARPKPYIAPDARPDWTARFDAVTSREEATALWEEAKAAGVRDPELSILVNIARSSLDM